MKIPGIAAKHCIVTDNCRKVQGGSIEAIDEALRRIRDEAIRTLPHWPIGNDHRFHFVFSVDNSKRRDGDR
jgi:hypothetical protein